jgi:phage terminase large subunit GpA-like protein
MVIASTPTLKGSSRIEREIESTDYRKWHVTCPACNFPFVLTWSDVKWPDFDPNKTHEAHIVCPACGARHDDNTRAAIVRAGYWAATQQGLPGRRGYHLSALNTLLPNPVTHASWLHWLADEWLKAEKDTSRAMVFVNTKLSEVYEPPSEAGSESEELQSRCYEFPEDGDGNILIPNNAPFLVIGADVQNDRLEAELVAFAEHDTTYGIEYRRFFGNTEEDHVWNEFSRWTWKTWCNASGCEVPIAAIAIDCRFKPERVEKFIRNNPGSDNKRICFGVFGIPGWASGSDSPLQYKPDTRRWAVKTASIKMGLYDRLQIQERHKPGFQHFPSNFQAGYHADDGTYFKQLTSEYLHHTPSGSAIYKKRPGRERNEALDVRLYATAAFKRFEIGDGVNWSGINWVNLIARYAKQAEQEPTVIDKEIICQPPTAPITFPKRVRL